MAASLTTALRPGTVLGSLIKTPAETEAAWRGEVERYADTRSARPELPCDSARLHPAYVAELGNDLLVANIALGPWIHTGSAVQHRGPLLPGQGLEVRGCVAEAHERKGRDEVELEVLVLQNGTCRAELRHRAIVRLPTRG